MLIPLVNHPSLGYDAPLSPEAFADIAKLGVAGDVYLQLPPQTRTDRGLGYLKPLLQSVHCRVGPFFPSEADVATSFLDAGAHFVVFDVNAADGETVVESVAEALASLPRQRLLIYVHESGSSSTNSDASEEGGSEGAAASHAALSDAIVAAVTALRDLVVGVVVAAPQGEIHSDYHKSLRTAAGPHTLVCIRPTTAAFRGLDVGRLHKHDVSVVYPSFVATTPEDVAASEAAALTPRLDVGTCLAACVRSDRPDGLFTTVVSDECGKTLGLVYSSAASIAESIRCGRGVYYSRSRGGLWRKGDTSGAWQQLLSIRLDCDSDALLFSVKQMGIIPAFCHLNTRNCWGEDGGLSALERILFSRKADAPPGSYTKRLFDDGDLLKNKLLEEAQELAEAIEPDHVAAEAADLIYFALVACARAGVCLSDIERHLDRRALKVRRRPGDAKPARIAAAKAHFDAMQQAAAVRAGTSSVTTSVASESTVVTSSAVTTSGSGAPDST